MSVELKYKIHKHLILMEICPYMFSSSRIQIWIGISKLCPSTWRVSTFSAQALRIYVGVPGRKNFKDFSWPLATFKADFRKSQNKRQIPEKFTIQNLSKEFRNLTFK
jgi:hypothetical protein